MLYTCDHESDGTHDFSHLDGCPNTFSNVLYAIYIYYHSICHCEVIIIVSMYRILGSQRLPALVLHESFLKTSGQVTLNLSSFNPEIIKWSINFASHL